MKRDPLVTVITPVFNGGEYLRPTIDSVINQTYSNIEYIVVDGGSSDNTAEIVKSFGGVSVFVSEPDRGMYDALVKGLERATGDIVCYINAGDYLYPHAAEVAVDIFKDEKILWLTGCRSVCNEQGVITNVDLPFRYKRNLIKVGAYGRGLPFIQQESTFWRSSLHECVDMEFLRDLRLAGDYYLWWCFAKRAELNVVSSPLGIFRKHVGQLSEDYERYFSEIDRFVLKGGLISKLSQFMELFIWALHPRIRAKFCSTVLRYDHLKKEWQRSFR